MHDEAHPEKGRILRYYGCHVARRNRSAVHPSGPKCDARMFRSEILEEAIHHELARFVPTGPMHVVLRNRLRGPGRPASSHRSAANATKRLDEQLDRARRLFEFGEYDWETFCARRVAGIFEHLEAEALPEGTLRVVGVPREAWKPFFEGLVLERETGFEPATSTLARSRSTK